MEIYQSLLNRFVTPVIRRHEVRATQPDLIVDRSNAALIFDVKFGGNRPRPPSKSKSIGGPLPKPLPLHKHAKLAGQAAYPDHIARVPRTAPLGRFIDSFASISTPPT